MEEIGEVWNNVREEVVRRVRRLKVSERFWLSEE